MKTPVIIGTLIGLALAIGLIVMSGAREIGQAILAAGWGIVAVIALHVPQMICSGQAWRSVVLSPAVPPPPAFLGLRLIREAVNALLPVAQIGGEFVGARLMAFKGVPLSAAGASVTVDLTLEMVSQVAFTLLGLGLLLVDLQDMQIVRWTLLGVVGALGIVAAFVLSQRFGLFAVLERGLLRLAERQNWKGLKDVAGLHQDIVSLYKSPRRLCLGTGYHFLSWLLGGLEVMAAFHVVGVPVGLRESLIVESLGQAFRALGFAIPGALGIQEGGLVLACALLGIDQQSAIELSLLKRVREVVLGVPGLLAWHWIEGRHQARKAAALRDAVSVEKVA
jgi:putative membrane protein